MSFNQGYVDKRIGTPPCMGCEDREHVKYVCHDVCERYLEWKQKREEVTSADREEATKKSIVDGYEREKNYRIKMAYLRNTSTRRRKKN